MIGDADAHFLIHLLPPLLDRFVFVAQLRHLQWGFFAVWIVFLLVGAPDGVGVWFCFVGVTVVVGIVSVSVVGRFIFIGRGGWFERGAETVGIHRVDAAGARKIEAVG